MFKVERVGPKRLNMEFSGKLDSTEMEMALDEIITHSEGIEDGGTRRRNLGSARQRAGRHVHTVDAHQGL